MRRRIKAHLKKNKNEICQSHITFMLQKYIEEEYKKKQDLWICFKKGSFAYTFAPENERTLTRRLCLIFLVNK